jgi:predicted dehydrogenase
MALFDALLPGESAIMAEKPLTTCATEHRSLVERFAPWRIAVGYQRRQYATNRLLRNIVSSRVFGELLGVSVAEGGRTTRSGGAGGYQDLSIEEGGGITRNLGCHSLDATLWITQAVGASIVNRQIEWDGRTDRKASAAIRLQGVLGTIGHDVELDWRVSWLDQQSNQVSYRFENATIVGPLTPGETLRVFDPKGVEIGPLAATGTGGALTVGQACYLEWRDLVSAFHSRTKPPTSARATLLTAEVMDALLT